MASVGSSTGNPQGQNVRQSARQTRTNPSRTSKTLGRSSFAYGHGSMTEAPPTPPTPHGFYPALTHFTDAITALPREFRRHNSLLKEVDAKAWALEDSLLQLLKSSSESQPVPCPPNPAPIVDGVVREDMVPAGSSQTPESQESKDRRVLFDRVRRTLVDLMTTADEKNHVISNANDELDRQLLRIDSIFPFIAGEISEESRLGNLAHWAYSNKSTAKTATNERPRRETAANKHDNAHGGHEAEASHRGDTRRDTGRKQRRTQADSDFDDTRPGARKGHVGKARGGAGAGTAASDQSTAGHGAHASGAAASGVTKRRKIERPPPVETGAAMERSVSGAGAASGRGASKDTTADATKKRPRAPNANAATRKRNNTGASAANSPILAPAPLAGASNVVRSTASPGPGAARPQSSRAQQGSGPAASNRQRPSSSASNRLATTNKTADPKATPKEMSKMELVAAGHSDPQRRDMEDEHLTAAPAKAPAPVNMKREDTEIRPAESVEPRETPAPLAASTAPKGRSSKTSTPALSTEPNPPRTRPTRNTDPAPAKRSHKKNGSVAAAQQRAVSEEEESLHEGDDEDEDGEPRYCYCNRISFGDMVACDNDACPREWFHLSCVGLTKPPGKNVKWYCIECKENMRRGRNGR